MRSSLRVATVLLLLELSAVDAQSARQLTIESIFGGELSSPSPSEVRFTPDGNLSFFLFGAGGRALWLQDVAKGDRHVLLDANTSRELVPSPSQATHDERERTRRTRFRIPDYHWSPDGSQLLLTSSGQVVVYDVRSSRATTLAPEKHGVLDPKFSPDGRWIAFVFEHDLWVVPVAGGEERRVTFGGSELILHGDLDWIYQEELSVRTGYHWSPDSKRIAYLEMDETLVPTYPIVDQLSRQATVALQRYPKPGDPNPRVRVGVVDVATARSLWIDRTAEYVPRIEWRGAESIAVQLMNRGQDALELIYVDARTGQSRSALIERDPFWVDVTDDLRFLSGGDRFLWTSERTGFRHIYLYGGNGELERALTSGEWEVSSIEGVDETQGVVYFTANRDNPIGRDLFRVRLDGSGVERLTDGRGTHSIRMSPRCDYYIDTWSAMMDPGGEKLVDIAKGHEVSLHEEMSLKDYDLSQPERRLLDTPDGAKVSVLLLKPPSLEPGRRYPLVVYAYGMPGFPRIRDSWDGTRWLFHQFLVQQGYVVALIDDRSSAVWGHQYAALADHNIGPLAVKDHEIAMEYLTSLSYVDGEHTGFWGWSGGGFTAAFHMTHTKLFNIAIAGAPVTDWHLYDSIYTERYMGTPDEDPEAYERTSAIAAASGYSGRLLVIHGTQDDNVHPQNTFQLINTLIQHGKQFDLMLYPNKTHGVTGRSETIHLWTMVFDYMERYLK
jgi:dipeptidyl-peptidase-4